MDSREQDGAGLQCDHLARSLAKLWEVCGSRAPAAPVWVERKEMVSFVPRSEVLRQGWTNPRELLGGGETSAES